MNRNCKLLNLNILPSNFHTKLYCRHNKKLKRHLCLHPHQGLNQQELDALANSILLFSTSITHKNEAVQDRDIATAERIELGNEIYNEIRILYRYGRDAWRYDNEAKYNDYIIYSSPKKKSTKLLKKVA